MKLKDRINLTDAPLTDPQRRALDAVWRDATFTSDRYASSLWCDIPDGAAFRVQRRVMDRLIALGLVQHVMRAEKFVFRVTEAGAKALEKS